jgi:hypothetical protein
LKRAGFRRVRVSQLQPLPSPEHERGRLDDELPVSSIAVRMASCVAGIALFAPFALFAPVLSGLASSAGLDLRPQPEQTSGAVVKVLVDDLDRLQSATDILEGSGARDIAASVEVMSDGDVAERLSAIAREQDLHVREYRDTEGNVHHHTRTFLEQHAVEKITA